MDKVIKNSSRSNIKLSTKSASKNGTKVNFMETVNNSITRELILEGLDCVNCAAKIEEKVSKINGISSANVNFLNKTLTLEIGEANKVKELIAATTAMVIKMEPDVKVVEKRYDKVIKKTLLLDGLG
jgi:Cd2+/Zn2+-exporting ATPase